jgi:hypothetical protein
VVHTVIIPIDADRVLVAHRANLAMVDRNSPSGRKYRVSSSSLIRFVAGEGDVFAIKHHDFAEPSVRSITAHRAADPAQPIAHLEIDDAWQVHGSGDPAAWDLLPALYGLVYPYVLHLGPDAARIMRLPGIPGYPEDPEDPYKLVPCPSGDQVIVTSTRAGGRFVVYDVTTGAMIADLTLGHGSPVFRFRDKGRELWLAHSDTLFRIDTTTWAPIDGLRLAAHPNESVISDLSFDAAEQRCVVAYSHRKPVPLMQPYRLAPVTGEVLVVDTTTFSVVAGAPIDRWADEVAITADNTVAMRERGTDINVRWADVQPQEFATYTPRDADDPTW